jgi:hypothetical protein
MTAEVTAISQHFCAPALGAERIVIWWYEVMALIKSPTCARSPDIQFKVIAGLRAKYLQGTTDSERDACFYP